MQIYGISVRPDGTSHHYRISTLICIYYLWLTLQLVAITTIITEAVQNIHFTMDEEVEPGYLVGLLYKRLPDDILTGPGNLMFRAIQQGSSSLFTVGLKDGRIKVVHRIDRETICPYSEVGNVKAGVSPECQLTFTVNLLRILNSTTDILDVLRIIIQINDINDNPCRFVPSAEQVFYLPEDAPTNTSLQLYQPTDLDTGAGNGIDRASIKMTLLDPTNLDQGPTWFHLRIKATENLIKPFALSLVLNAPLDYEAHTRYVFSIEARGGINSICQLMTTLLVTDVNDNSPRFSQRNYTVHITEGVDITSPIFTASASDDDAGPYFSQLLYDFDSTASYAIKSTFRITHKNGSVFLKQPLSKPLYSSYNIPLIVRNLQKSRTQPLVDLPDDHFVDRAQLIVYHTALTNKPPAISVYTPEGGSLISIPEHSPDIPLDFAVVTVTSDNLNFSGAFSCKLVQLGTKKFELTPIGDSIKIPEIQTRSKKTKGFEKIYKLSALVAFDRETTSVVHVAIVCREERSATQVTSEKLVEVQITDKNDHFPEFIKPSWRFLISEDSDPQRYKSGYIIGQVTAVDMDDGENAELTYELEGEDAGLYFLVDNRTGVIKSRGNLDREQKEFHQFTLVAIDGGKPPLTSSTVVEVIIQDYNDEVPKFSNRSYIFHIQENNLYGEFVGSLTVVDMDKGLNGALIFHIDNVHLGSLPLRAGVEKSPNGEELPFDLVHRLDTNNVYEVRIYARTVLDREQSPHAHLSLSALDYLTNDESRLERQEEYRALGYTFLIIATDDGIPPQRSQAIVQVVVDDVNDNAPFFQTPSNNSSVIKLSYLEQTGHVIYQVYAVDEDAGLNGTVCYKIQHTTLINQTHSSQQTFSRSATSSAVAASTVDSGGKVDELNLFGIQSKSGVVYLTSRLNALDVGKIFAIEIVAHDLGTPKIQQQPVNLYVYIDDSAPIGDMNNDYQDVVYDQVASYPASNNYLQLNLYIIVSIIFVAFFISTILIVALCIALRRIKNQMPRRQPASETNQPTDVHEKSRLPSDHNQKQSAVAPLCKHTKMKDRKTKRVTDISSMSNRNTESPIKILENSINCASSVQPTSRIITIHPGTFFTSVSEGVMDLNLECLKKQSTSQVVTGCASQLQAISAQKQPVFVHSSVPYATENTIESKDGPRLGQAWVPLGLSSVALPNYDHTMEMQHLCAHIKHPTKRNSLGSVDKDSGQGDSLDTVTVPILSGPTSIWFPTSLSLPVEQLDDKFNLQNRQSYINAQTQPTFTLPLVQVYTPLTGVKETEVIAVPSEHL